MRNAECGMRNGTDRVEPRCRPQGTNLEPSIPHSAFRIPHSFHIPHSALGHVGDDRLSRNEDGEVTQAVTHTPHPTQPSGRSTGWPPPSIARARSPTGHARAHTPQLTP